MGTICRSIFVQQEPLEAAARTDTQTLPMNIAQLQDRAVSIGFFDLCFKKELGELLICFLPVPSSEFFSAVAQID